MQDYWCLPCTALIPYLASVSYMGAVIAPSKRVLAQRAPFKLFITVWSLCAFGPVTPEIVTPDESIMHPGAERFMLTG